MEQRQRTKRFGIAVILWACIFRLILAGVPELLLRQLWRTHEKLLPIYSETGREVRFSASSEKILHHFRESPAPWIPEPKRPSLSRKDAALIEMDYDCALRPDLEGLLTKPLDWDLTAEDPAVLILHTPTTESYTKSDQRYTETAQYRTLDEGYNMLSIGEAVARILEENGIGVIHDRQIHDYPSYNGSYVHSRGSAESILQQYPSIRLVLDLHRDALEKNGKQIRPVMEEGSCAQLMFVVGTNVSRQSHSDWQENLSLALKLHVQLQRQHPGIMRPVNLRSQRFNQDLSPGALLVEVGAAGNTHEEAMEAARRLAEAVVSLAAGVESAT